jgi:isocitrate/isopropylmalate dehydrogenase
MSKTYNIAVLKGDGIGPEITDATIKVLEAIQEKSDFKLNFLYGEAGFHCIEKCGTNLPEETIALLKRTDACLKGPMTTPEEAGAPVSAAVKIRKIFNLYANVRPCKSFPSVESIKPDLDFVVVRENTEGLYAGAEFAVAPGVGIAYRIITTEASTRVAEFAFKLAQSRKNHLPYVHKGYILRGTDGIFKDAMKTVAKKYPDVTWMTNTSTPQHATHQKTHSSSMSWSQQPVWRHPQRRSRPSRWRTGLSWQGQTSATPTACLNPSTEAHQNTRA